MFKIRFFKDEDDQKWDSYVLQHASGYHSHLIAWKNVIEKSYNIRSYYLIAEEEGKIKGIFPLFFINNLLFGKTLVSMPYLTYGGVLADSPSITQKLIDKALGLSKELAASFEMRMVEPLNEINKNFMLMHYNKKVSMRLELPPSSDELFKKFKPKLRSQIRRPIKEGMKFCMGNKKLINDFYKVFSVNMRDLGSPVHSIDLFNSLFLYSDDSVKIGIVYYREEPVAAGIITLFKEYVEIPWASSLRKYNRFSPNMLLYWEFLKFSCDNHFKIFDFGRSSPGDGTYRFKAQWGSKETKLNWYSTRPNLISNNSIKKRIFISLWKNLPLELTKIIGPKIRKGISL